jgi:hypothetical protein
MRSAKTDGTTPPNVFVGTGCVLIHSRWKARTASRGLDPLPLDFTRFARICLQTDSGCGKSAPRRNLRPEPDHEVQSQSQRTPRSRGPQRPRMDRRPLGRLMDREEPRDTSDERQKRLCSRGSSRSMPRAARVHPWHSSACLCPSAISAIGSVIFVVLTSTRHTQMLRPMCRMDAKSGWNE